MKRRSRCAADPGAPESDGAVVRMKLSRRTNPELRTFVGNHLTMMEDNPNFSDPQPPAPVLDALFDAFTSDMADVVSAKTALEVALTACDASRTALEQAMQVRGAYIQAASNGNCNAIVGAGLDVRSTPTPVGQLSPPLYLTIELNGIAGLMKFLWHKVKNARGYILEYSPNVMPRQFVQLANTTKTRFQTNLPKGETWVFRVAAFGGSTGQSAYGAEVVRGSA